MQAQRRAGASFNEAWTLALTMVSRDDRRALEDTKGAWQRAYLRQPFYSGARSGSWPPSPPSTATLRHGRRKS